MENIFKDIVWWAETQTKMPGKEELDDWEFGRERRHAYLKNDQLHNFLRLSLQDEALTIVKSQWSGPRVGIKSRLPSA